MTNHPDTTGEAGTIALVTARGGVPEMLRPLAAQARLTVQAVASAQEVARLPRPPQAVLMPLKSSPGQWAIVRGESSLATVPLLGVSTDSSELSFAETFSRGGDDLLALDRHDDVLARLRAVAGWRDASRGSAARRGPGPGERRALIVGHEASWRADTARLLQRAGFGIDFATPGEPLEARIAGHTVGVLEATEQPGVAVETLARLGGQVPWVVAVKPDDVGVTRMRLTGVRAAVHDRLGLADALPFVVNELLAAGRDERRRTARLLFATRAWVRLAGSDEDQLGYTYTVSEGGLFWRSLAPLPVGSRVWLELQPPRLGRRIRLSARVAWSRGFGPIDQAASPPGSGLEIEGGLPGDWEQFQAGCRALLAGRERR